MGYILQKQNLIHISYASIQSFFHYNTPNNTLGLFWQDLMDFSALFPRKKKKRTELSAMQKNARNRKREEEPPVIYGIEDGKMAVMLVYCLGQPKGIFIDDFAIFCGFYRFIDVVNLCALWWISTLRSVK